MGVPWLIVSTLVRRGRELGKPSESVDAAACVTREIRNARYAWIVGMRAAFRSGRD